MEHKTTSLLKNNLSIAVMGLCLLLLFIPLSALVFEILLGIEILYAIIILVYSFTKFQKAMPKLVLIFALFSLALNISFTRISLTGYKSGVRVPITEIISNAAGGENFVLAGLISVVFLTLQILLVSKGGYRISEIAAKFELDLINIKMFEIDSKLNQKLINENEAYRLKKAVSDAAEYYSLLDGSAKFLSGVTKANIYLIFANFAGGTLIQVLIMNVPILAALQNTIFNIYSNVFIFTIPILFVSFAAGLSVTEEYRLKNLEKIQKDDSHEETVGNPEVMAALQQRQAEITKNEFMIELGFNLLKLADATDSKEEAPLLIMIPELRKEIPELPRIRIIDNVGLKNDEYFIHWKDVEIKNSISAEMSIEKQAETIISNLKKVFEEGK